MENLGLSIVFRTRALYMNKFFLPKLGTSFYLFRYGLLSICLIVTCLQVARAELPGLMFYIGQMDLDPGVNFTEMTDHGEYIQLRGTAPSQLQAYRLAEKLFQSRLQNDLKFSDIIPFWEKNKFIFTLKKPSKPTSSTDILRIEGPGVREMTFGKLVIFGKCSQKITQVSISGDLTGETNCLNGKWTIEFSVSALKLPIIGVQVGQRRMNQKALVDFRSFLIK